MPDDVEVPHSPGSGSEPIFAAGRNALEYLSAAIRRSVGVSEEAYA